MRKLTQRFNTAAQDSNPGSLSRESEALPLSHCTLMTGVLSGFIQTCHRGIQFVTSVFCSFNCLFYTAKKQCRLDIRKFTFSQRTINEQNRLSADCVGDSNVTLFKKINIPKKSGVHLHR